MIKDLLLHHAERAHRGHAYNALQNCHARGVWSVVLHDEPENRIRMFFASAEHDLDQRRRGRFTLGIHPHHCDVCLVPIFGPVENWRYIVTSEADHTALCLTRCRYQSAITGGGGRLIPDGHAWLQRQYGRRDALADGAISMRARELHTIHVPAGQRSAWLVIEGAEDPFYQSVCYTDTPDFDAAGLYVPAQPSEVFYLLTQAACSVGDE